MRMKQKSGQGRQLCPDKELAARIEEIKKLQCKEVKPARSISQKEAEKKVRLFSQIKNNRDGRIAEIPISTIGKILRHKGYDISKIFNDITVLYEESIYGWSEPEIETSEHKPHTNITSIHHYINKFFDGNQGYYIRFTISEEKVKQGRMGKNYIHSTAISNTLIYENGGYSQRIRNIDPGETNTPPPFIDKRLIDFFNSVK